MIKRRHYIKLPTEPSPSHYKRYPSPNPKQNQSQLSLSLQFNRQPTPIRNQNNKSIMISPQLYKEVCLIKYKNMDMQDQYLKYSNIFKLPHRLEKLKRDIEGNRGHSIQRPCRAYHNFTEIKDKKKGKKLKSFKNIHPEEREQVDPYPCPSPPAEEMPNNSRLIKKKPNFIESKVTKIEQLDKLKSLLGLPEQKQKLQNKKVETEEIAIMQQKDPLKLATAYNSKSTQLVHEKLLSILDLLSKTPTQKLYSLPSQQKIPAFIQKYIPISPQICISDLLLSPIFQIESHFSQQDNDEGRIKGERAFLYFGEKKNGRYHGLGVIVSEVEIREGEWEDGGQVKGIIKNSMEFYQGEMKNGLRHGFGESRYLQGEYYEGHWQDDQRSGNGYFKFSKTVSYFGEWQLGHFHGKGVLKTQISVYEGFFESSMRAGTGKQKFKNGDHYDGSYQSNLPSGTGKYLWKQGTSYEGAFNKGQREGYGVLNALGKVKFMGNFKNDLPSGVGKAIYNNGDQYHGLFYKGERSGRGDLLCRDKKVFYTGDWLKNNLVHDLP